MPFGARITDAHTHTPVRLVFPCCPAYLYTQKSKIAVLLFLYFVVPFLYTWACLIFSSSYSFLSTPIFSSSSSLPTTIASVKFTYHVHGLFDRCRGFDWHWLMFAIIRFEPAAAKRIRKNNFFASIVHCRSGHRVSIVKSHNNVRSSVFCVARWIVFIFLKAVSRVVLYVFLLFSFIPSYKNIFFKALGDLVGQFFNKTIWEQLKKGIDYREKVTKGFQLDH